MNRERDLLRLWAAISVVWVAVVIFGHWDSIIALSSADKIQEAHSAGYSYGEIQSFLLAQGFKLIAIALGPPTILLALGYATRWVLRRWHDRKMNIRSIGIWIFGLIASALIGAFIASRLGPHGSVNEYFNYGLIAGACAFACTKLWLGKRPN